MAPPITTIGQISIRVHDIERAIAFYRDALGLEFLFDTGPLAFLMCGDVRLMLTKPEADEFDHPSSTLYSAWTTSGRPAPTSSSVASPSRTSHTSSPACPTTSCG